MTRRERAAMELALNGVRFDVRHDALPKTHEEAETDLCFVRPPLQYGLGRCSGLSDAMTKALRAGAPGRLVRARLALYLRARLRAEGREEIGFGRWVCAGCGSEDLRSIYEQVPRFVGDEWRPACRTCGGEQTDYTCRIAPLWELAPSHGGGR